jgi:CDP-glucose 4,6-dehydratase
MESREKIVNTWVERRVFVTGHTGYKGSWLCLWLAGLGARLCGYALDPETEPNLFSSASVALGIEDVRGDIRDAARLESALTSFAPEVVFHLAAQPLVRRSYSDPIETFSTNVIGTAQVLEAVRKAPTVRAVICVTSDKCYENREWIWPYRETDALGGHDPYSSSKACAEIVSAAYRNSFFPPEKIEEHRVALATARVGNVIGGGDWSADRLIPDLIRGFQSGEPVKIRNPKAVRPWQHVLDPIYGYVLLAERMLTSPTKYAQAFNFGPNDEDAWPVEKIASRLTTLYRDGAGWICDSDPAVHEAGLLRLDSSKARAELGWSPRLRLDEALVWTAEWYTAWKSGADMHACTQAQISAYQKLISQPSALV